MTANPFRDSTRKVRRQRGEFALGVAEVKSVDADRSHTVLVQPLTTAASNKTLTDAEPADVLVSQNGDVSLPAEGDLVVYGHLNDEDIVVLDTLYGYRDQVREYAVDERHLGQDDGGGVFLHGPFAAAPSVEQDPSDPPDGAVWYRSDLAEYRGQESGTTVTFDTTDV